jgi:uncharacterized protein YcnI
VTGRLSRTLLVPIATTAAVLAFGIGTASAHVSVSSTDAAPGGSGEITFRVPTESDTASTISLRVQLPTDTPIAGVGIKPVPGWSHTTRTTPLNPPVTDDDGNQISQAVSEISWTADPGTGIKPGEYQTFSISAGPLPKTDTLVLPTIQGYGDGTEVAWIDPTVKGQSEPRHPAPTLNLTSSGSSPEATTASSQSATTSSDSGTSGLPVTALVLAIIGLVAGLAALVVALTSRRRNTTA